MLLNTILPVLTMAVTFAWYTAVQKQELTAATGGKEETVGIITDAPLAVNDQQGQQKKGL